MTDSSGGHVIYWAAYKSILREKKEKKIVTIFFFPFHDATQGRLFSEKRRIRLEMTIRPISKCQAQTLLILNSSPAA